MPHVKLTREQRLRDEWKPIPGWPYSVSNMGRVRRDEHRIWDSIGRRYRLSQRLCKIYYTERGPMIQLEHRGKIKTVAVKTLVADAFLRPRYPTYPVLYKGSQTDASIDNLYQEKSTAPGKLEPEERKEILRILSKDKSWGVMNRLAKKYDISRQAVHQMRNRYGISR